MKKLVGPSALINALGSGLTISWLSEIAVPAGVVTAIFPCCGEFQIATMTDDDSIRKEDAATPPMLTAVASVKFVPLMVMVAGTSLQTVPGAKALMAGDEGRRKLNPGNEVLPPGVLTATSPEAPSPTTAVIVVSDKT